MPDAPPLPPRSLVVTVIEDHPKAIMLLRAARKRAQEHGGKWRAVCIETPAHLSTSDDGAQERMLRLLTLATQMGGEVAHLEAKTTEEGLRALLESEKERMVCCILGATDSKRRKWRTPPWERLARMASDFTQVEIIPLTGDPMARAWPRLPDMRPLHFAYALTAVGVAFAGTLLLQLVMPPALFRINNQNIALVFMIACAFVAGRYGLLPGLLASLASFFTMNYFFTSYRGIVGITDAINMGLFLSAALLISLFASQTRDAAKRAARRELSTQALFALYRLTSNAYSRTQALEKLQRKLAKMLEMEVAFFLPPALSPDRIEAAQPPNLVLDKPAQEALEACWTEMYTTGLASPFNPGTEWRFEPMLAPGGEIGVLGVRPKAGGQTLDPWYGRLISAIADQTATILEHIELERSMEATRIREEREKLRSMLLSSVSHDLKTPLAGIIGALSVHNTMSERLTPERRNELLETALGEAHRLDSFITNILDMTRLESGTIEFRQEWQEMPGILQQVRKHLQHRLRKHALNILSCPSDIEIFMDPMMTEQVLQNLVDNACKYTPPGTPVEISCRADAEGFLVEVRDHGNGLPEDKLAHVFDKYARLHKEDSQVAGTGLGLAICKAVMEAQGGWISAGNHPEKGAVFTICLPQWRKIETSQHVA